MANFVKKAVAWPPREPNSVTAKGDEADVEATPHTLRVLLKLGLLTV
jgi:hypothetical protein